MSGIPWLFFNQATPIDSGIVEIVLGLAESSVARAKQVPEFLSRFLESGYFRLASQRANSSKESSDSIRAPQFYIPVRNSAQTKSETNPKMTIGAKIPPLHCSEQIELSPKPEQHGGRVADR
jgi:hypothetical protein